MTTPHSPLTVAHRDGIAFLLAAMRGDHAAIGELSATLTHRETLEAALYCAYFAATQMRTVQALAPGTDIVSHLQREALTAAASADRA